MSGWTVGWFIKMWYTSIPLPFYFCIVKWNENVFRGKFPLSTPRRDGSEKLGKALAGVPPKAHKSSGQERWQRQQLGRVITSLGESPVGPNSQEIENNERMPVPAQKVGEKIAKSLGQCAYGGDESPAGVSCLQLTLHQQSECRTKDQVFSPCFRLFRRGVSAVALHLRLRLLCTDSPGQVGLKFFRNSEFWGGLSG